ncbi:MAG TPA: hypothetical protein VF227_03615 [Actinomycetes bacterium]
MRTGDVRRPFLGRVRERVAAEIERAGVFRIGNQVGIFTCR